MVQRFTITPDPPSKGQQAIVCYAFSGLDPMPDSVVIAIDYSPDSIPGEQITVTPSEPCKTINIPANATSGILTDLSGESEEFGFGVN